MNKKKGRTCAICGKPYTGAPHAHRQGGLPKAVVNVGPVARTDTMIGSPPTR